MSSKNTFSHNRALKLATLSLAILILALVPVGAFATGPPPPPTAADHDVIIVGAGAAGLYAAFELNNSGFDVLVLEAQGRHGGRVEAGTIGGVAVDIHAASVTGRTGVNWHYRDIENLDSNRLISREGGPL